MVSGGKSWWDNRIARHMGGAERERETDSQIDG